MQMKCSFLPLHLLVVGVFPKVLVAGLVLVDDCQLCELWRRVWLCGELWILVLAW